MKMNKVTLGGDRLGAGKKQKVELQNYERSTHDLSYVWRSTMSSGTLVPFMNEVALPGDTFDINLNCEILTNPTVGPLFGSYKVQLDVFSIPMRLYNGKLQMNMLNIGLKMSDIKIPQVTLTASKTETYEDNTQINPSSLFSYLNIRGLGHSNQEEFARKFNAIPYLAYWDIYKNYYANKQEEVGVVIHNNQNYVYQNINTMIIQSQTQGALTIQPLVANTPELFIFDNGTSLTVEFSSIDEDADPNTIFLVIENNTYTLASLFTNINYNINLGTLYCTGINEVYFADNEIPLGPANINGYIAESTIIPDQNVPRLKTFPLSAIDDMRTQILIHTGDSTAFEITQSSLAPYNLSLLKGDTGLYSKVSSQEGLAIKTYQSDLFNNWISTEWIDGENGINAVTAVDTTGDKFTLDTLELSRKVYDMLNRIAVSGGSYDDWLNAVYTHERTKAIENPMYMGGLIKELAFQEVISNSASNQIGEEQPLGTIAGRGVLTNKNKGGKVIVRVDEPSYVMGIISLTPRIDYSQGNKWDVNLKTFDDFHKPGLDGIGFEDLITDQMDWRDTSVGANATVTYKSAGKQPAWINYMTNVNQVRGNFAEANDSMFMTLNRKYSFDNNSLQIKDLTTYIDPSKYNHVFADTRLDAQNFWAQIGVNITARRKMSAKIMPNL